MDVGLQAVNEFSGAGFLSIRLRSRESLKRDSWLPPLLNASRTESPAAELRASDSRLFHAYSARVSCRRRVPTNETTDSLAACSCTLSAELVEEIDRLERNRSRFIAEAIEHELARRRREALLSSVRSPHPETADVADTGLGDWTSDLPDDEGLVDVAGGTAVRWVEGQGWVRESA